jgi:hypothetical protein
MSSTQISRIRKLSGVMLTALLIAPDLAAAETCIQPDQMRVTTIDRAFVQERFLAGMAEPLRSEGRLEVSPEKIRWHMTSPFDVETILTPTEITQAINGGTPQPVAPSASDVSASLARLFGSLLQGRWSDLQSVFRVSKPAAASGAPWSVSLEALDPQMAKILGNIEVLGCTDISTIKIDHQNGDREVITFAAGAAPAP